MSDSNAYIPFASRILDVTAHTAIEYTFRLSYEGDVIPGQFFEVSIPKFGEAPISVSGIGDGFIELTIRKVGTVTGEVFEHYVGDTIFIRGPYGNGFRTQDFAGRELAVIAGGTGMAPVRGVVEHFVAHPDQVASLALIAGFKSPDDILFASDFERWGKAAKVTLTVDADPYSTGRRTGLVTEFIPSLDFADISNAAAIVVGPAAMMRFSIAALLDLGLGEGQITLSQERRMCCGLGKCGHCRINDSYVCLDGPVFNYANAAGMFD